MRLSRSGFTLVELLVVIVIIGILVALIAGIGGSIRNNAAKKRAAGEIAALGLALERYKTDNGDYPDLQAAGYPSSVYSGNPNNYRTAGQALFLALMGRSGYDDTTASQTEYITEIHSGMVGSPTGTSYFIDPFGYAYGYYYDTTPTGTNGNAFFNEVEPDIWSTGGETGVSNRSDPRYLNWIANWDNS